MSKDALRALRDGHVLNPECICKRCGNALWGRAATYKDVTGLCHPCYLKMKHSG